MFVFAGELLQTCMIPGHKEESFIKAVQTLATDDKVLRLNGCRCGEMADAQDLKSWGCKKPCRFESDHRHQRR